MEVTFKFKYTVLIFLHFIDNIRSVVTNSGNKLFINGTQKLSYAQSGIIALQWPKGIVTYYLDNLVYDNYVGQSVRRAMNVLESASCVRFRPSVSKPAGNDSASWIHITNPLRERNCVHEPEFMNNGEIVIVLGFDCLKEREILHALLHAIGFEDEVTHPQRDQYIRVMWNNIQPEYRHLYRIRSSTQISSKQLVEYDPLSNMHFHDRAFSVNGHATVMSVIPGLLISPAEGLSHLDKMRLRLLFGHECNRRKVGNMIDTCKILLSSKDEPNVMTNVSDPKSEEKQGKTDEIDKSFETEETPKTDKDGSHNQTNLNSNDSQNNISKSNLEATEVELEIETPTKVLSQKIDSEEQDESVFI